MQKNPINKVQSDKYRGSNRENNNIDIAILEKSKNFRAPYLFSLIKTYNIRKLYIDHS